MQSSTMISSYGSAEAALYEAELYNIYDGYIDQSRADEVKQLIIDGSGSKQTICGCIISSLLDSSLSDVVIDINQYEQLEGLDFYTQQLAFAYYINPDFVARYTEINGITSQDLFEIIDSTIRPLYPDIDDILGIPSTLELDDEIAASLRFNSNSSEYVSVSSGKLGLKKSLASIPGNGGMDIEIALTYDSETATAHGKRNKNDNVQYYPGGSVVVDVNINYDPYIWENKSPFLIAAGWRLNYDYISIDNQTKKLHLTNGNTYSISSDYKLTGLNADGLTLQANYYQRPNSAYKLSFQNGTTEYFDMNGNLVAIEDRFGNVQTFLISLINIPVDYPNANGEYYNRRLTIKNADTEVYIDYCVGYTRILLPDGEVIHIKCGDGNYELSEIIEPGIGKTTYRYNKQKCGEKNHEEYDTNRRAIFTYDNPVYYFITGIDLPTGAKTEFEYKTIDVDKSTDVVIKSRKDICEDGAIRNQYTYNLALDTGRFNVCSGDIVHSYQGRYETVYLNDKPKKEIVYSTQGDIGNVKYFGPEYGKPIDSTGSYIQKYDYSDIVVSSFYYTYDNRGNITSTTINGMKTDYAYYSHDYYLPKSVTYNIDNNTAVREAYTLTDDKKNISDKSIYVNDVLVEKTSYSYDSKGNIISEKRYKDDSSFVLTQNQYNNNGWLVLTSTSGVTKTFEYDAMGRVSAEICGNNERITSYTYENGRISKITYPDGSEEKYNYQVGLGVNSSAVTDEAGVTTTYNYDGFGNLKSVSVGSDIIEELSYDSLTRIASKADEYGVTKYTYDWDDRPITVRTLSADGSFEAYKEEYAYSILSGEKLSKTTKTITGDDSSENIVYLEYYDEYSRLSKSGYLNGQTEVLTRYTYNGLGRKLSELSYPDFCDGYTATNTYTYDYAGRLLTSTDALGYTVSNTYDMLGNKLTSTDQEGNTTAYKYDDFGNVLTEEVPFDDTQDRITEYSYDAYGNQISKKIKGSDNQLYSKTEYVYDQRDNLTEIRCYTSLTDYIVTAEYTYDGSGKVITSTLGGLTTTNYYDLNGNIYRIDYPDGGSESYSYSAGGRLDSKTDKNGVLFSYTYDSLGNILCETAGTESKHYTYTKTGQLKTAGSTSYTYDCAGRKKSETNSEGTTVYSYNYNGNIAYTIATAFGKTQPTSYTYDRAGRLVRVSDSVTVAYYAYTNCGRISSSYFQISTSSSMEYAKSYSYNKAGLLTSVINWHPSHITISSYSYTYRPDGNIASETEYQSNFVDKNLTTYYNYDLLGRLISEQSAKGSKVYSYDDAGNRTRVIIDGTSTVTYSYINGRLVSKTENTGGVMNTVSYAYDSNGNMISETEGIETTSYAYDVWGNLVAAGDTTYEYDYAGIRTSKDSDRFYNINGVVAIEKVGDTVYTSLLGIERIRRNDTLYLYDAHGNVVNLINSSGIEKVYDYDAYGNQLSIETGDDNPFRYCGEYYDEETGLIYLRARYYDPTSGRFISEDSHWNVDNMIYGDNPDKDNPKPDDSAIKQSGNIYAYCMNNPVNYIDRTGNIAIIDDLVLLICCAIITVCATTIVINSAIPLIENIPYSIPSFESIPAIPFERSIVEPKVKVKTEAETITDAIPIPESNNNIHIFPDSPFEFWPTGLVFKIHVPKGCGSNGGVIKWEQPGTKIAIFEWDEDYKNGSHYHVFLPEDKNKHTKGIIHYYPGSIIPEPWNTIYFGGK